MSNIEHSLANVGTQTDEAAADYPQSGIAVSISQPQRSRKLRFLRWLLFNALLSLAPLAFSAGMTAYNSDPVTFGTITSNGELLMISSILVAGALGELFPPSPRHIGMGMVTLVMGIFVAIFGSSSYGYVVANRPSAGNEIFLGLSSLVLFVVSIIVGIGCIVFSE